jgi:predicted PurR-regulated permease PerM
MDHHDRLSVPRLVGLAAAALLAFACLLVLRPFVTALAWAVILVFVTWPAFQFLRDRARLSAGWAALVMVTAEFLLIGLPLVLAAPTGREDLDAIRGWVQRTVEAGPPDVEAVLEAIPLVGGFLAARWLDLGLDFSGLVELARPYVGIVAQAAVGLLVSLLSGLAEVLLAIFLAFFIYKDGAAIALQSEALLARMSGERARHMLKLTGNVTRGVVYGLLGTAIAQGVLTALGLWVSGVPQPVLLGVVAGFVSIFPVGAPLVWLPASLWLFGQGETGWGLFLFIYGAAGISSVDNFIRPWLISRGADLPFLLTLLGALGGVFAFGLIGLFLGPVVLAVGYSLLKDWAAGEAHGAPPP